MPTSREEKKRETRRALSSAALRLATDHGLHGFTLEAVAAEAGVSARTFFNYFSSKEAAIVGLDEDELMAVCAALGDRPEHEGPVDALVSVLVPEGDALGEESAAHILRNQLTERFPELLPQLLAVEHQVQDALAAAMSQRLDRSLLDPYPHVLVAAVMAAMRAATEWHHRIKPPQSLRDTLVAAATMVGHGLEVPG